MSEHILIVERPSDWPDRFPRLAVVGVEDYLTGGGYSAGRRLRLINLCRSYSYGSLGYYCSLLAEARGHRVIPTVRTIQDLSRRSIYGLMIRELDQAVESAIIKRGLSADTNRLRMMVLLGRSSLPELQGLAQRIFEQFRAPLLRVDIRFKSGWHIADIRFRALQSLSEKEEDTFIDALKGYMSKPWRKPKVRHEFRYDIAILHDPGETLPPSNGAALRRFVALATDLGMNAELIQKKDYGRIAEYDALFIRETTAINHHTFRFSRRAQNEGLVVIDDPDSILRCTNKVFLEELLRANRVPTPKTQILSRGEQKRLPQVLSFPIILKIPDGSFSRGVSKVNDAHELAATCRKLFKESDLILAQEYMYTDFDWRVGILDREPLFVCKYMMSAGHWQIYDHSMKAKMGSGDFETLAIEKAPKKVIKMARRAANLIGDGLYGVDLKETPDGVFVIEVNDNPSIEAGVEDNVLRDELYRRVMMSFRRRLDQQRAG